MRDKDLMQRLHEEIEDVLQECETTITPKVCELRSTPNGKRKIVGMIAHMIITQGYTIGSAIQSIERTFNDNLADD